MALVVTFACGCGDQPAVDHGGSLVSEEGQIAFTRMIKQTGTDIEADIYTINVDGSKQREEADGHAGPRRIPQLVPGRQTNRLCRRP